MTEHTTLVSVSYKILGESTDYTVTFPVSANSRTTVLEVKEQLEQWVESEEMASVSSKFALALVSHLANNTKD